ncbi:YjbQ family protein [Amycolatopsis sp. NPDC059021]|uniref:YjbQ family protein n=1 Tax=Amycolatopsis sp. NPDC059021 TaxID=3346704 RepID=UPI003670D0DF
MTATVRPPRTAPGPSTVDVIWERPPALGMPGSALLRVRTTDPLHLVDLTDQVGSQVDAAVAATGASTGQVVVTCGHTSCGLIVNESETGLREDLFDMLSTLAPPTPHRYWAHDDLSRRWENLVPGERPNGHSHVLAMLATHPSVTLPLWEGRMWLGQWQRIMLLECDGGRTREVLVQVWTTTAPTTEERAGNGTGADGGTPS